MALTDSHSSSDLESTSDCASPSRVRVRCYIALGSNLNGPHAQIIRAIKRIASSSGIRFICASSLYESHPVGPQDQPDFVNAVIEIETSLEPFALLSVLKSIEQQQGRRETYRWGPRVIDCDILLYGDQNIVSDTLCIPHPRMQERDFVMIPLKEICDSQK